MSTTNHVLALPQAFLALRIAQLVVGIVILGLSAYIVTFIAFDSACLTLFTAIATIIIAVYSLVSSTVLKTAYNYWAIVALDIFAIIFWIISFSYLASTTAAASNWYGSSYTCDDYYYYYCYKKRDAPLVPRATTNVVTYRHSMAAAAGLGGLEFILFAITLIFTTIHVLRHRKAGGHCTPVRAGTGPDIALDAGPAPVYSEAKTHDLNAQNGQQQYVQQPIQQPVQQYVQQPQQPTPPTQYVEHSGQAAPQHLPQQEYYTPQQDSTQHVQSA
ncbi:hypothetical protein LHYA1_G003982 [Lachnellula hyalina]|uniref:MARVEL domain-containing protein n=1 Tax=Lachnellula hyalina TaxID=1316788 RepID=A0A8H8U0K4_9HELO|nr:uncharacterized protein LHYA1_G003982 [Lachnellula hyalina]TVY26126.1 hypothetical protein LHYA1_G003982 [Lachnellula hyalina]